MAKPTPSAVEARELWESVPPQQREDVRSAIAGIQAARASGKSRVRVSTRSVRERSRGKQIHVVNLVRLYKAGLAPDVTDRGSWLGQLDGSRPASVRVPAQAPEPVDAAQGEAQEPGAELDPLDPLEALVERIRGLATKAEAAEVMREAAALGALGILSKDRAAAVKQLMTEARQYLKDDREDPTDAVSRTFFAGPEAVDLIRLFEGIVDDSRRAAVLEFALGQARLDLLENPAGDMTKAEAEAVAG